MTLLTDHRRSLVMNTSIKDVKSTLDSTFGALTNVCSRKSHLGFLCLSAMIDYLSKLAYRDDLKGWERYPKFIKEFFPRKYSEFEYKTGEKDLPRQMYYVLRNGMVHSFTLVPNEMGRRHGGRLKSIVLCHRREAKQDRLYHLHLYKDRQGRFENAALFVMEDFLEDTKLAAYNLMSKAKRDSHLRQNVLEWFAKYPPITGGFRVSLVRRSPQGQRAS